MRINNMQEFEPISINTSFQWKMDQYDWLNLYYNSVHVYIECWDAWVLCLVTKEVIMVQNFNRHRWLEERETLCRCSTTIDVANACGDVICWVWNLSRFSNSVVWMFRLVKPDVEPVETIEVFEVLEFFEVLQHANYCLDH